jgi:hypothetical protein
MFTWLLVMTGGLTYMFRSQIMESYESFEANGGVQKVISEGIPVAKSIVVDTPDVLNHEGPISHKPKEYIVKPPPPVKAEPKNSNPRAAPEVLREPIKLSRPVESLSATHVTTEPPPGKTRKKITDLLKFDKCDHPPPILKGKDMWGMKVQEQRQYLQDIHCMETDPSPAPADRYKAEVQEAMATPQAERNPSLWDVPEDMQNQIKNSKPGDSVKYRIAGKDVTLPYGYPEESIFVLTASYRDPEVAFTIARAYARYVLVLL